jgi:adenosylcobyric acid synthase
MPLPTRSPSHPPLGRVLMVQGTSSHAGKSTLVAALCRIFAQEGFRVAPFKSQNMSLNSAVTIDGAEIGRAQMLQAQAARVEARADMNPVLLKPQGDSTSQVVVLGKVYAVQEIRNYYSSDVRQQLWPIITGALDRLRAEHDIVVVEGAGSPAEINLRDRDLANMRVAKYAKAPVLLVGDIERGGVFASLMGTMVLLDDEERALVRGFVINKFRGDASLIHPGPAMLEERTGVPTLGVLPYFTNVYLPEEDSMGTTPDIDPGSKDYPQLEIAIPRFPHIANSDDFDTLRRDPRIRVRIVSTQQIGNPDLIILPGSKTTIADLDWLRKTGLAAQILECHRQGTPIIGICGGFQMLGQMIHDPYSVESDIRSAPGLGILPIHTTFEKTKATHQARATVMASHGLLEGCGGLKIEGYEIHMGTTATAHIEPALTVTERSGKPVAIADGATTPDGMVFGTYLHGLFHNDALRERIIQTLASRKGIAFPKEYPTYNVDDELDKLAEGVRAHLDIPQILRMVDIAS